jgi:hypothetical protein
MCEHEKFRADVAVHRVRLEHDGPIESYALDLKVWCDRCGEPFTFRGQGPVRVSLDYMVLSMGIQPVSQIGGPLDLTRRRPPLPNVN